MGQGKYLGIFSVCDDRSLVELVGVGLNNKF